MRATRLVVEFVAFVVMVIFSLSGSVAEGLLQVGVTGLFAGG
jgi:hypothetical protein